MRVTPTGFAITGFAAEGGGWRITWESTPGAVYAVERSASLNPPDFADVPGLEAVNASDGATTSATDSGVDPEAARFYRIRQVP